MASANARKLPQTPDQARHNDNTSRLEPVTPPPPPPPTKNADDENAELRRVSIVLYVLNISYQE